MQDDVLSVGFMTAALQETLQSGKVCVPQLHFFITTAVFCIDQLERTSYTCIYHWFQCELNLKI